MLILVFDLTITLHNAGYGFVFEEGKYRSIADFYHRKPKRWSYRPFSFENFTVLLVFNNI